MPFYTFKCPSCNQKQDVLQSMKSENPTCEKCIENSCGVHKPKMERVFRATGKPQFKGTGFYETDYKKKPG